MVARQSIAERFWRRVDRSNSDACWPWRGHLFPTGYGSFGVGGRADHRTVYAHRMAWELTHGPIPAGLDICHHCDNPPCVNPAHLFPGTRRDNMRDASAKGRIRVPMLRGEDIGISKLSEANVHEIRAALVAGGETYRAIAERFGVSRHTVGLIRRGRIWRHLGGAIEQDRKARGETNGHAKLTDESVVRIRALLAGGDTTTSIASRFGISQSLVSMIGSRKRWAHVQ